MIADDAGHTMIVEIPLPSCIGGPSPFTERITNARAKFDSQFHANDNFQNANITVQVTGVGFFDRPHAHGAPPNGIELHPVLDIVFNPSTQQPTPSAPTQTSQKWEYKIVTAQSAEELLSKITAAAADGWELVSATVDDKRTDRYVAFLKRAKQ